MQFRHSQTRPLQVPPVSVRRQLNGEGEQGEHQEALDELAQQPASSMVRPICGGLPNRFAIRSRHRPLDGDERGETPSCVLCGGRGGGAPK
jgi:hypothetical protein